MAAAGSPGGRLTAWSNVFSILHGRPFYSSARLCRDVSHRLLCIRQCSYDKTVTQVNSEQLLLNIVRTRYYRPVHFTTVSSVAATFDFRVTAGITPPEGEARGLVAPIFNTTVAENPTITIVPMGGAEFTRRLLTPMDETRFLSVLQLGADMGMILRMMASAMRLDSDKGRDVLANEPGKASEYEEFRRRSLHLASLLEAHQLHIEPIMFEEVWAGALARSPEPEDVITALGKGYRWTPLGDGKYVLNRMRLVIANYPPSRLPLEERRRMSTRVQEWPPNDIIVDIRPRDIREGNTRSRGGSFFVVLALSWNFSLAA